MKKTLRKFWTYLEIFIIVYVIILTLFILCKNSYGYIQIGNKVLVNVTIWDTRNINNVKKDDLLIIKPDDNIKNDDTIYYYIVSDDKYVIKSSKVIEVIDNTSYRTDDVDNPIIYNNRVIGNSMKKFKKIGGAFSFLDSKNGYLIFALIPIILVFLVQFIDFIFSLKKNRK